MSASDKTNNNLSLKQAEQIANYQPRHGLTVASVLENYKSNPYSTCSTYSTYSTYSTNSNKLSFKLNNQLRDYFNHSNSF